MKVKLEYSVKEQDFTILFGKKFTFTFSKVKDLLNTCTALTDDGNKLEIYDDDSYAENQADHISLTRRGDVLIIELPDYSKLDVIDAVTYDYSKWCSLVYKLVEEHFKNVIKIDASENTSEEYTSLVKQPRVSYHIKNQGGNTTTKQLESLIHSIIDTQNAGIIPKKAITQRGNSYLIESTLENAFALKYCENQESNYIKLVCSKADNAVMWSLGSALSGLEGDTLCIFSTIWNLELPKNYYFIEHVPDFEKLRSIFDNSDYEVVLVKANSNFTVSDYYLRHKKDSTIHYANRDLIELMLQEVSFTYTDDLSYKVADDWDEFLIRADSNFLPKDYYGNYEQNYKILNYTSFNIEKFDRRIGIVPFVQVIGDPKARNYNYLPDAGMNSEDIEPGETIGQAVQKFLSKCMGLENDYFAIIINSLTYRRCDDGVAHPALVLNVYLKEIDLPGDTLEMLEAVWSKLDDNSAKP